jgi:hypothetical protein
MQLRLLVTLCAHPWVRDLVLRLAVPKPRAWVAAEQYRRKQLDGGAAVYGAATQLQTGFQQAVWERQSEEASRPTVDPLQLAFLCLRLPVSLSVKAQLLALAAAVAAAGPERACKVS